MIANKRTIQIGEEQLPQTKLGLDEKCSATQGSSWKRGGLVSVEPGIALPSINFKKFPGFVSIMSFTIPGTIPSNNPLSFALFT